MSFLLLNKMIEDISEDVLFVESKELSFDENSYNQEIDSLASFLNLFEVEMNEKLKQLLELKLRLNKIKEVRK